MLQIYTNFESLYDALERWSLDFKQMSEGEPTLIVDSTGLRHWTLHRCLFNKKVQHICSPPQNMTAFSFLSPHSSAIKWNSLAITEPCLLEQPAGYDCLSITMPELDIFTFTVSNTFIREVSETLGLPDTPLASSLLAHRLNKVERQKLYRLATMILEEESPLTKEALAETLVVQIIDYCSQKQSPLQPRVTHRRRGLLKALSYIHANIDRNIGKRELARACFLSNRTLEYAFRNEFGLSPKQYIKIMKLNMVHSLLINLSERDGPKIKAIASRFGFRHMNHFTSDYKALFGWLPSESKKFEPPY